MIINEVIRVDVLVKFDWFYDAVTYGNFTGLINEL